MPAEGVSTDIKNKNSRCVLFRSKCSCCHLWVHHECFCAIQWQLKGWADVCCWERSILSEGRASTAWPQC